MTTNSNSPLLQVSDQTDSVMLGNLPGTHNTVAILDDKFTDRLFSLCRKASEEAQKAGDNASAMLDLCTALEGVLKPYRKMRDEYHHRIEVELERDDAEQRLQEVQNAIQKSSPPSQ